TTDDNGVMSLVTNSSHTYGTTHTTFVLIDGQANARASSSDNTTERRDHNGQLVDVSHQTQDTIYFYQDSRLIGAEGSGTTSSDSNELVWTTDQNGNMSLVPNQSHSFGTTHTTFVLIDGQ